MIAMYEWLKAVHVIAVIAWMAGMLYLPRLFVYHVAAEAGSVQAGTFEVMERRLLRVIMLPAMIAAWVLGLWLAAKGGWFVSGWLHVKLAAVLAMSGLHGWFARMARDLASGNNRHSQKFFRMVNEVPTVLMIIAVVMAVVKPF